MIKSMTGYGKAVAETPLKKISFEVKSLNSKQLDLNTKLPWLYKEKESEIRNMISKRLDRGKIDVSIYFDVLSDETAPVINKNVVKSYYKQLADIAGELDVELSNNILDTIMKLPDSLKAEKQELDDAEWELVKGKLEESLEQIDNYRIEEGKSIESDFRKCLSIIGDKLQEIGRIDGDRITKIRQKLSSSLAEFLGNEGIDKNRFEQEVIYYIEKLDINEEKVRLRKHCDYFLEKMDSPSPNGKVLNFIAQEMGREINTIGSKANDADIQKLVVRMKDELEKIKEQTLNVL